MEIIEKEELYCFGFMGLNWTYFLQNFLQYLYPNDTAWFNDKFPQFNIKIGVMTFVVNKSESLF